MGTVRYTTVNGEVIAQTRNGVCRQLVPDPLGSTVAMLDNTQTVTDTFAYWPYGKVAGRTGTTQTPLQYVGTRGYYQDSATRSYVRARSLGIQVGRWITEDPIGFEGADTNLYRYVRNRPQFGTDASGLQLGYVPPRDAACSECANAILNQWVYMGMNLIGQHGPPTWQHQCNHGYAHCMACCALAKHVDELCANQKQNAEILIRPMDPMTNHGRWQGCNAGKAAARQGMDCDYACQKAFPWSKWLGPPNGGGNDGTGTGKTCGSHLNDPVKALPPLKQCCPHVGPPLK